VSLFGLAPSAVTGDVFPDLDMGNDDRFIA
jgi:hypothetical protein